jgi:hypothetical protein
MDQNDDPFFPSGAIAFFIAFMVLYGAIWQVMYFVTVLRG